MAQRGVLLALLVAGLTLVPTAAFAATGSPEVRAEECVDTEEVICPTLPPVEPVDDNHDCVDDISGVAIAGCVVTPPVETPVETPEETFDDSDDGEEVVVPPVVVTPTPTPTPTPTRTVAPAPAGWNAPLYGGEFNGGENSIALLALAGSGVVLARIGAGLLARAVVLRAGRQRRPVRETSTMSEAEATATVLPAIGPDFTAFDRQVLGYDLNDKTTL